MDIWKGGPDDPEGSRAISYSADKFIVPLIVLYDADRNSGFRMTFPDILNASEKLLQTGTGATLDMNVDAISEAKKAFAIRYYAFARYNSGDDKRALTRSIMRSDKRNELCRLILTHPLVVTDDAGFGVGFDPETFERDLLVLSGAAIDPEDPSPCAPGS